MSGRRVGKGGHPPTLAHPKGDSGWARVQCPPTCPPFAHPPNYLPTLPIGWKSVTTLKQRVERLSLLRISPGHLCRIQRVRRTVLFELLGGMLVQCVVRVGVLEKEENREQKRTNVKSRRPIVPQNVEANLSFFVDTWVIDLCRECHLRRLEWVFGAHHDIEHEYPSRVRGVGGAVNDRLPI